MSFGWNLTNKFYKLKVLRLASEEPVSMDFARAYFDSFGSVPGRSVLHR